MGYSCEEKEDCCEGAGGEVDVETWVLWLEGWVCRWVSMWMERGDVHQRQETCWVRAPPIKGPATAPIAMVDIRRPMRTVV